MNLLPLEAFLQVEAMKFVFVLTRVAGILSFGPLVSSNSLPRPLRIYAAIAITILVVQAVPAPELMPRNMIDLVVALFGEIAIGFILGGFLQTVFQSLQIAGQLAGQQFGLALANVVNPQLDDQVSTTSLVYLTIASLIFLSSGGFLEMFAAILQTFATIPLGAAAMHDSVRELAMVVLQQSMIFSIRVAAPATVAMLLAEIGMGFVGRTVPQLNILSVGFSIRIFLGLTITIAALDSASGAFLEQTRQTFELAYQALANLAG